MGFVNAGIDGTALPSLPRPLQPGWDKLRNFWVSAEPEVWGCEEEEEEDGEQGSQMSQHMETGLAQASAGFCVLCL